MMWKKRNNDEFTQGQTPRPMEGDGMSLKQQLIELLGFTGNTLSMRVIVSFVFLSLSGECLAESSLEFTGRYEYRTDSESLELLGDFVCFYPSPESSKHLLRSKSDKRLAWFCFKNEQQSKKLLGIPLQSSKANNKWGRSRFSIDF